jgi:hypothetical protein
MSLYREIQGYTFQSLSSDPSPLVPGQIWYNTTTNTVKSSKLVGTWASANNMVSPRASSATVGIQTAALAMGSGPPSTGLTEKYDGTNWTSVTAAPFAAGYSGAGTQDSALAFGDGSFLSVTTTAKYDGTSWTAANSMTTGRTIAGGCGTQTAALACGGRNAVPSPTSTELYDGTNWTVVSSLTAPRPVGGQKAIGISTAALVMGGSSQFPATYSIWQTESYNGTSWTGVNNLNVAKGQCAAFGTATLGVFSNGPSTEQWTNTAWYTDTVAPSPRPNGCGSQTSALTAGPICLEWEYTGVSTNTITIS